MSRITLSGWAGKNPITGEEVDVMIFLLNTYVKTIKIFSDKLNEIKTKWYMYCVTGRCNIVANNVAPTFWWVVILVINTAIAQIVIPIQSWLSGAEFYACENCKTWRMMIRKIPR